MLLMLKRLKPFCLVNGYVTPKAWEVMWQVNVITFIGRLVLSEEVAVGDIGFKTYNAYVKAAGGWAMILIVVGMYLISAGSVVFTDWWLSEWIGSLTEVGADTV